MSDTNYKLTKITKEEARKIVARIIQDYPAGILWTRHCLERLEERCLTTDDVYNVLASPQSRVLIEGECNPHGVYSYRVETNKMFVAVSFSADGKIMAIVTVARKE